MEKRIFSTGDIALSLKGRDKGTTYLVVDIKDGLVLVVDGKRRKAFNPKAKNPKHLELIACGKQILLANKIKKGGSVGTKTIKTALEKEKLGGNV